MTDDKKPKKDERDDKDRDKKPRRTLDDGPAPPPLQPPGQSHDPERPGEGGGGNG